MVQSPYPHMPDLDNEVCRSRLERALVQDKNMVLIVESVWKQHTLLFFGQQMSILIQLWSSVETEALILAKFANPLR